MTVVPRGAIIVVAAALALTLALAGPAFAVHVDNGEGFLGETNDKVITFWGMLLVVFLPALPFVLRFIQSRLERRKERRKAAPH